MADESRSLSVWWIVPMFLLFTLLICVAGVLLGGRAFGAGGRAGGADRLSGLPTDGQAEVFPPAAIPCVVIDAGHGGEDGGTSSAAGLVEKDVNLAVATTLRELLEAAGVPTVMTRTEDKLLYDRNVDYQGRKKVLDLAARHAIAEATPGCLFVSIHMNAFTDPRYSGMQVWYGTQEPRSRDVAEAIQAGSIALMPTNHRRIKAAGSDIYLLDRATGPAVLVECGFLSNPAEAERLSDEEYQQAVAFVIFEGIMGALSS